MYKEAIPSILPCSHLILKANKKNMKDSLLSEDIERFIAMLGRSEGGQVACKQPARKKEKQRKDRCP